MIVIAPNATRRMPIFCEFPVWCTVARVPRASEICLMKSENLTTTKPKPMMPMLVLIQARKVLSLARWSPILFVLRLDSSSMSLGRGMPTSGTPDKQNKAKAVLPGKLFDESCNFGVAVICAPQVVIGDVAVFVKDYRGGHRS